MTATSIPAIERSAATLLRGTHMDFPANTALNHRSNLGNAIDRGLMWLADLDGAVVGFLFAEPEPAGLYLRELAVAGHAQRRGLGAALMNAGIAAARERGYARVMLTTDRTLPWNAPFYARLGFGIVEGDAIPAEIQRRLHGQYAAGFDPAARCAMVLAL